MWNYTSIALLVSVCFHLTFPSSAKFLFKRNCDYLNTAGINLYQQSVEACKGQCELRSWCKAVHFFKIQGKCALLGSNDDHYRTHDTRSCIYIQNGDMDNQNTCDCSEPKVCDPSSGVCSISKCPAYEIPNLAEVLGNMHKVGSRVKVKCKDKYEEIDGRGGASCQPDGTWGPHLFCFLAHCEDPVAKNNAVLTRGSTRQGSIRSYQCTAGYGVNGLPSSTSADAICSYGTWIYQAASDCIAITPTIGNTCLLTSQCLETDSMCTEGKCFCSPMYRYNSTLKNCVKVCANILDSFKLYVGAVIDDYNAFTNVVSINCRGTCLSDPRCMAYEEILTVCSIAHVNVEMILDADPGAFKSNAIANLYSRECA